MPRWLPTHPTPLVRRLGAGLAVSALCGAAILPTPGAVAAPDAPADPAGSADSIRADLRVDADRDGRIDLTGDTDQAGKTTATPTTGAVFLPNLDDDGKRCTGKRAVLVCSDAGDARVNGEADAADLARIKTPAVSNPADLPDTATARLTVDPKAAPYVRIFHKSDAGWSVVTPGTTFTAAQLRAGLELGIEGKQVVIDPARWNGTVDVALTLTPGGKAQPSTDRVRLRVAPMLAHDHTQKNEQLLISAPWSAELRLFRKRLAAAASSVPGGVRDVDAKYDVWAQDYLEPMYVSMPAAGGTQAMRLLLKSDQERTVNRGMVKLKGPGVGTVQIRKPVSWNTTDSFGNLETIPPYTHQGKSWPAGRIIMGYQGKRAADRPSAAMMKTLRGQGMQDPLMLDTSFLHVGHVDEFVQFIPAKNARGWKVVLADPRGGLKILRGLKRAGRDKQRLIHYKGQTATVRQALADREFVFDNRHAGKVIDANLARIKKATGITDADVVRLPSLYYRGTSIVGAQRTKAAVEKLRRSHLGPKGYRKLTRSEEPTLGRPGYAAGKKPGKKPGKIRPEMTSAYVPGAINGVVVNGSVIVPQQFGPRLNKRDVFADAIRKAYRREGLRTSFIDDFTTYHAGMGEIHCGTNSLRATSALWWKRPGA